MKPQIKPISLSSDEILIELIRDSLDHLLSAGYEVVADNLPFEGHHLLVLDDKHRPVIVSCDLRDGGRALLHGLAVVEGLTGHRGMLYRLYPSLFGNDPEHRFNFRQDDARLIVLAPRRPPGGRYLRRAFPFLSIYTFQTLEVGDQVGLLIEGEPPIEESRETRAETVPPFRNGTQTLTQEEEQYFRDL